MLGKRRHDIGNRLASLLVKEEEHSIGKAENVIKHGYWIQTSK